MAAIFTSNLPLHVATLLTLLSAPSLLQAAIDPQATVLEEEEDYDKNFITSNDEEEVVEERYPEEEEEEEDSSDEEFKGSLSFSSLFGEDRKQEDGVVEESLMLVNCGLSDVTVNALESRGIKSLFPIQKVVFTPAMEGSDMIARAKTGSGKTLAFALPVIEKIMANRSAGGRSAGRTPQCIVLAPTRELAKQVEREFGSVCPSLFVGCYYGGVPIGNQLRELRRGIDVCVGTPGRVIDLIEQRALDLSGVRFVILDEADQMLDIGFEKDVERILESVPEERQTMLFSATVPKWVKGLCKRFLKDPVTVDLVGQEQSGKLAESIAALAVEVTDSTRRNVLVDLLTVHGAGGKAIVFTKTKREADEVAAAVASHLAGAALHGDMGQNEREKVLASFRAGRLTVLVATDVAARGLDIADVDVVVHYDLPQDAESFLHRSGRTGRAGKTGTTIAMYTRRQIGQLKRILRETKTEGMEMGSAPGPAEVMTAAAKQVMRRLDGVDDEVREYFRPVAQLLLSSRDPQEAMEAALAALSGITSVPQPRSLLTFEEGLQTMQMMSQAGRITKPGHISAIVGKLFEEEGYANAVGKIRMIAEGANEGAAFDVPHQVAQALMERQAELHQRGVHLSIPAVVPPEEGLYSPAPRRFGSRNSDDDDRRGGGRFGGRGGNFGGDRRGRSSGGGGSYGGRSDRGSSRGGGSYSSRSYEDRGSSSGGRGRSSSGSGGGSYRGGRDSNRDYNNGGASRDGEGWYGGGAGGGGGSSSSGNGSGGRGRFGTW